MERRRRRLRSSNPFQPAPLWHNLPITREYTLGQLLDQTFTEADVAAFCKDRISWFKIPKYVHFLDEFPMTASQKIQKYKLRDQAHELWPEA